MTRSFDAADLIQLPRLDVTGAVALGGALAAVAEKAGPLPEPIAEALAELGAATAALRRPSARKPAPGEVSDPVRAGSADRQIDAAWLALHDWLSGWARLPGGAPQALVARALLDALFADGTDFTLLAYALEWAESEARLRRIRDERLDERIRELGGAPFLEALAAAHKEYGEALGAEGHLSHGPESMRARTRLDVFLDALRVFLLRVSANTDRKRPASVALATQLLEPLARLYPPPDPAT